MKQTYQTTSMWSLTIPEVVKRLLKLILRKPTSQVAQEIIECAVSPDVGRPFKRDYHIDTFRKLNEDVSNWLWRESERLCNVKY